MKLSRTLVISVLGISLVVLLALLLAGTGTALALVEQLTLDELTAKADSILVGEVTDITCYQEGEGYIYTLVTLSVEQTIKGAAQEEVVIKLPGGEVDGLRLWVSDTPSFHLGERVVVFLEEGDNAFEVCGWYQGRFTVEDDSVVEVGVPLWQFKSQITDIMRSHGIPILSEDMVIEPASLELTALEDHSWHNTGLVEEAFASSPGWQTIMTEDFEGAFPGSWVVGDGDSGGGEDYWDANDYRSYTGDWSGWCADIGDNSQLGGTNLEHHMYDIYMNACMIRGPFNLSDATDAELNFWLWLDSESNYDYVYCAASINETNFFGTGWSGDSGGWLSMSFDLTDVYTLGDLCGQPQVWIAFVFQSDYSIIYEGAYVDDIELRKYVAEGEPPHIDLINPSSASAGTESTITITGTNFGATQDSSTVSFFYRAGEPRIEAPVISWSDTSIVCEVPVAIINDYPASASSGPVIVHTASGDSNGYDFFVTFSYMGFKWPGTNPTGEKIWINPNTTDCTGEWRAVINTMQTWNDVDDANFYFEYGGLTTATDYSQNGNNEIMWVNSDRPYIAAAYMWGAGDTITECDVVFNDFDYTWDTSGSPTSSQMDVQNTATHELGHCLGLRDLYGNPDSQKTMYGFGDTGETQARTLEAEDIAGIQWIYPGTGTRGQYHIAVTNSDDDDLEVYFKSDIDAEYYRHFNVPSGQTLTSWWEVVPADSHQVSIKWTDPDKGTEDFLTSGWLDVPVEGDTEFPFTIPLYTGGTIEVTSDPSGASFSLSGPQGYSGTTPWSVADAPVGDYTITWGEMPGYKTPSPETKTLVCDGTISFHGPYQPCTGTINVTSDPSGASFSLSGPQGYSGTTPWSVADAPVGDYTITWGEMPGYKTPSPETKTLVCDGTISFHGPYQPCTGTINVTSDPSGASFSLSGPQGYSDTTPWSVADAPVGDYTITWGEMPGYDTPSPETKTLVQDGTISFHGPYQPCTGTINVTSDPSGASFSLSGPQGYSGTTPWSVADAPVGDYTITWGEMPGYETPPPETKTLVCDGTISFHGPYQPCTGTINVTSDPSGASFSLSGPQGYSGTTPWSVADAPVGDYTITWGEMPGYDTPSPETKTLVQDGSILFHGVYIPESVWSVPMTASTASEGSNSSLEFGTNTSATDGYDSGIDIPHPPQGLGVAFDAYFEIADPTFPQLDKDYRVPADSIQWTLHVESNSEPITIIWDASGIPAELFAYMDTGISVVDLKAQASTILPAGEYSIAISVGIEVEIEITLKAGWNMVSVPVTPGDPSVGSVFAGVEVIYTWNSISRSYYSPTEVEPCKGYWVAVIQDTVIQISGVPVYSWTSDITAGWNMIGSLMEDVSFTDPQDDPDGSVEPFAYWWDPVTKSYVFTTTIESTKGYWVAATQDCTLTLSTVSLLSLPSLLETDEVWSVPMTASTATEGSNPSLEFGTNTSATDGYDSGVDIPHPPQGPGVTFDAYFEIADPLFPRLDKDYRAPADSIQWTLHVESHSEDITITWDVTSVPEDVSLYINGTDMKEEPSITLPAGEHLPIITATANNPPWIDPVIPDQSADEDVPISIDLTPYENDVEDSGTALDWSAEGLDHCTVSGEYSDDDVLTFTPDGNFIGDDVVSLILHDSGGLTASQDVSLTWNDVTPPYTSGHDPAPGATDVPIDTNIVVHVQDDGAGVDIGTIAMTVEGAPVSPVITGTTADYTLSYDPPVDFAYLQVVDVTIDASDLAGNPMSTDSYSFTTGEEPDTTPPYTSGHDPAPGATDVPIDTNIVVHVQDDGAGVDIGTIAMTVEGAPVSPVITGTTADYTLSYDPPVDFAYLQVVDVTIDASDLAGNPMSTDSYPFTTGEEPDTTPPYTSGHDPAPGATGVPIDTNIVVHVQDDGAGVDIGTIAMTVEGAPVSPVITGTTADYTLSYDPPVGFAYLLVVDVTVDASDLAGNPMSTDSYSFTTEEEPDTTPPYTSGHDPAPGATDVPIDTNIVVHVQDDGAGVDIATIAMTVEGAPVSPVITGTTADYTLSYDPPVDFAYLLVVDVTVDASDLAGNPMSTDSYSFTTEEEPDTTPPYTSGHDPAPGATDVPIDTNIVVHVQDDGAGVDNATIAMTVEGAPVSPVITGTTADYTLSYDPPVGFAYLQVVDVTIDASDLAGNPMSTDSYSFTTGEEPDTTPPYTSGHDPAPGATDVPIDTNIVVHVQDDGAGVDIATIAMTVEGAPVSPVITGTTADYTLSYDPPTDFDYGQEVNVTIDASDLAGNPMSTDSYPFTTEEEPDTTPPYTSGHDPAPGATDVPIDTNIVVHVQDDGAGVDIATIAMTVEGAPVSPVITGTTADYTLSYDPPVDFAYLQVVDVTIDASDLAGNPMTTDSYSFTTNVDSDGDGVPDTEEQGPDRTDELYDGNGDGIADSQQGNVASLHTYDGQNYVTIASPDGTTLGDVQAVDNPSPEDAPADWDFPYGFFEFTVSGVGTGDIPVTLYLPEGASPTTYYKYGPTPGDPTPDPPDPPHWYEFLYDGTTGAEISGNIITLHFVDGERGDDDLTANGTIVEPGGPGQPREVAFSSATYDVGETDGSATITVNLSDASTQTVTVDYATSDGTATAGSDYTTASGTLTFAPGDTTKSLDVTILDDGVYEGDETVDLALSNPSNATLGTPGTAILTIKDNESPPPSGGGGGGGGGDGEPSGPELEVDMMGRVASGPITEDGVLEETIDVTSPDGIVLLRLPEGILALDSEGNRLEEITVDPVLEPPALPENWYATGMAYDFSPDGASFEGSIELTIGYDPEELAEGVNEWDLVIGYYHSGSPEWRLLPSVVDTGADTVTSSIDQFSVFAIIWRTAPAFTLADLSISPSEVDAGESVTISAQVTNSGGMEGSYTITLLIDGTEEATQELRLAPGASDTVNFAVTRDSAGTYSVEIDGLAGEFTVQAQAHPFPWALFGGILGGMTLAVAGLALYLWWRRGGLPWHLWWRRMG